MAWRPTSYLLDGELDNTNLGHVRGWLRFEGLADRLELELLGDFHRDIRGAKLRLLPQARPASGGGDYLAGLGRHQTGKVGDITAGLQPHDYGMTPYVEWYSDTNGRIVLELGPEEVEVVGTPLPWDQTQPCSRAEQDRNMADFLTGISEHLGVPAMRTTPEEDTAMTHWLIQSNSVLGEARPLQELTRDITLARVRLRDQLGGLSGIAAIPTRSLKRKAA